MGEVAITPRSIDAGVGIGEIFVDKYRVDAFLGHGGMGVVALCTHLALNKQVAIKMLRRDVLDDADAVERFLREAQAAVQLRSEFVARVSDSGRSSNNVPYMVMEYLEGYDLGDLLDKQGSIGMPWAIELTLQACDALAEAHSLGIIHRDVKPTNLFVTWRPDGGALIKVLDFGISKALTGSGLQLTQTQSLLGTPAYMSPEQMRSARNVDARTDIWSLGTVLYEILEGHRPFEAESFSEMCVKVAVDPPDAMTNTPLALQQVVLRCLEKAPEARYQSMADLARDLVPFSHDPHQAKVLVDRMARTLRRSSVEWNQSGNSGPVRMAQSSSGPVRVPPSSSEPVRVEHSVERSGEHTAVPMPIDAVASGPVTPVPQPGRMSGSGPAEAPLPSGSGAAIPVQRLGVPEPLTPEPPPPPDAVTPMPAPAAAPAPGRRRRSRSMVSETLDVVRPRRRSTVLLIAAAAAVAAAIGVVISLVTAPAPLRATGASPAPTTSAPHDAVRPATPPAPSESQPASPTAVAVPSAVQPASPTAVAAPVKPPPAVPDDHPTGAGSAAEPSSATTGEARPAPTAERKPATTDPRGRPASSSGGRYYGRPRPGIDCQEEGAFERSTALPPCPPRTEGPPPHN